jgi:pimeloyl-ACP methyl ester carboxylesterase
MCCALVLTGCLGFHTGPIPGAPRDATYAEVEGARVRYVDEGEGPAVVLLHGYASSLETWDTVRPALRESHRVLALDLKGFGWSDRPPGDYSPEAQARLVLALMDARGIERAAIVAHSWGSSVALSLALIAPERVTRVALYDAFVYPSQRNTFLDWADADGMGEILYGAFYDQRSDERIALAFYDDENLSQGLVDAVEAALDRPGTQAAALAVARGMHLDRLEARLDDVTMPVLLLWGREDRVTRLSSGERLQNDLPNARLQVYPRCGHFPMIEAARPSRRDLIAFLAEDVAIEAEIPLRAPEPVIEAPIEAPLEVTP